MTSSTMLVKNFIAQYRPIINQSIQSYLKPGSCGGGDILEEAMLYSFAGGKRARALLAIASFLVFERDIKKIMPLCCAIEIAHAYTLIHDDLPCMDDDDYRRGQPTSHKKFGEDMAVLAGDALQTLAFEILASDLPEFYPADRAASAIRIFAEILGRNGVLGGQVLDIKGSRDMEDYEYLKSMHKMKTGALISASVFMPLVLLGRLSDEIDLMKRFGDCLGLLFQITDDILDVTGTRESLGKTVGKDADQNKLTYVSLFGLRKAREIAVEKTAEAKDILSRLGENRDVSVLEGFADYILHRAN